MQTQDKKSFFEAQIEASKPKGPQKKTTWKGGSGVAKYGSHTKYEKKTGYQFKPDPNNPPPPPKKIGDLP
jgi:hypothetical protein